MAAETGAQARAAEAVKERAAHVQYNIIYER